MMMVVLIACLAVGGFGFVFALLNGDAVGKALRFVAGAAFVAGVVFLFSVSTDVGILCSIIVMITSAILLVLAEIWNRLYKPATAD